MPHLTVNATRLKTVLGKQLLGEAGDPSGKPQGLNVCSTGRLTKRPNPRTA